MVALTTFATSETKTHMTRKLGHFRCLLVIAPMGLIAMLGVGCEAPKEAPLSLAPTAVNTRPGPPDSDEVRVRLLLMSERGLLPRRLSPSEADQLVVAAEALAAKFGGGTPEDELRDEMAKLDALSLSLTGLTWGQLDKVPAPW